MDYYIRFHQIFTKIQKVTTNNPFKTDFRYRLELAYNLVPESTVSLLDYGCSNGIFLFQIKKKLSHSQLYGYDVDTQNINPAEFKARNIKLFTKALNGKLPIKDKSIDIITILDVIEHVPDESRVFKELYRILKPNGILLLSTPNKGLTEIFDPGNLKFRFPQFHKILYKKVFTQNNYEAKYENHKYLSGDVTRQNVMWHRHYSISDLQHLSQNKFKITQVNYFSLFLPILGMLRQALIWKFNYTSELLNYLLLLDSRSNFGKLSFSLFVIMVKKS